jgi:hypothetical protein
VWIPLTYQAFNTEHFHASFLFDALRKLITRRRLDRLRGNPIDERLEKCSLI